MLIIKKELVPLFHGNSKKGIIHIALVDEKGYEKLIEVIDKGDSVSSTVDSYPPFNEFAGLAYQRHHEKGYKDWWVIFNYNPKKKINIDTIAHESLHITRMILDSRGVLFDPNNDEPFAYMVGWVASAIYRNIPKKLLDGKK